MSRGTGRLRNRPFCRGVITSVQRRLSAISDLPFRFAKTGPPSYRWPSDLRKPGALPPTIQMCVSGAVFRLSARRRRYAVDEVWAPRGDHYGFFLALGFCWQLQRGREAKLHHLVLRWPIPQVSVAVACAEASLLSTCVTAAHRFLSLAESDQEIGLGTGFCWNTEFGWGALGPSRNCAANCPAVPPASCGPGGFAAASHPASAPVAVQEWPARWW
jgi:hypothetical protein